MTILFLMREHAVVLVLMPNPRHRKVQGVFIAAFGHAIEVEVKAEQLFRTACVSGISMEDVAGLFFAEHAETMDFLASIWLCSIVVVHRALSLIVLRKRY